MKAAICDDDLLFGKNLQMMLEETECIDEIVFFYDVEVLFAEIEDGILFDVIFMDIYFKNGDTGIDNAEKIYELDPSAKIIYVTGYNDKYSQLILLKSVNLCGYLVKPVDKVLLRKYLDKIQDQMKKDENYRILVSSQGKTDIIFQNEIFYLESKGHKVCVHKKQKAYSMYNKLDEAKKELSNSFIQCHKSFIVNMDEIKCLEGKTFILSNGEVIPISRSRYQDVKKAYFEYISDKM